MLIESFYKCEIGRGASEDWEEVQRVFPEVQSEASLITQLVKNLPAMRETWVQSLGWEDPVEKGKATHSSILTWKIPWTIVHGVAESDTTERLSLFTFTESVGTGRGGLMP